MTTLCPRDRFSRMIFRSLAVTTAFILAANLRAQDTTTTRSATPRDTVSEAKPSDTVSDAKPSDTTSEATPNNTVRETARRDTVREAPRHVMVGSGDESYLRYLQDAGLAALYPWSLREFSQQELASLATIRGSQPWSGQGEYRDYPARYSFRILPVNVVFRFNSGFP